MKRSGSDVLVSIIFCLGFALIALFSAIFLTNVGRYAINSIRISFTQPNIENNEGELNSVNDKVAKLRNQQEKLLASSDAARFCHYSVKSTIGVMVMCMTVLVIVCIFFISLIFAIAGGLMIFEPIEEDAKKKEQLS